MSSLLFQRQQTLLLPTNELETFLNHYPNTPGANFIKLWHFQYRGTATEEIRFDNFGHAIVVVGPLHRRLRTAVRMANHGHVPHSYFAFDIHT